QEPLRKIHTFADLLQEEYGEHFDGHADYYLNRSQDSAGRLSRLINDLLSFSRVTMRGRLFEQVDLNVTAAEVMADLELAVSEADAHVEVAPLPVLVADRTQMHQLLQNLIQNAIKYRRPGTRPEVRVTADVMESDGLPGHATLEVV